MVALADCVVDLRVLGTVVVTDLVVWAPVAVWEVVDDSVVTSGVFDDDVL